MTFTLWLLVLVLSLFLIGAAVVLWRTGRHISEYERLLKEERYEESGTDL